MDEGAPPPPHSFLSRFRQAVKLSAGRPKVFPRTNSMQSHRRRRWVSGGQGERGGKGGPIGDGSGSGRQQKGGGGRLRASLGSDSWEGESGVASSVPASSAAHDGGEGSGPPFRGIQGEHTPTREGKPVPPTEAVGAESHPVGGESTSGAAASTVATGATGATALADGDALPFNASCGGGSDAAGGPPSVTHRGVMDLAAACDAREVVDRARREAKEAGGTEGHSTSGSDDDGGAEGSTTDGRGSRAKADGAAGADGCTKVAELIDVFERSGGVVSGVEVGPSASAAPLKAEKGEGFTSTIPSAGESSTGEGAKQPAGTSGRLTSGEGEDVPDISLPQVSDAPPPAAGGMAEAAADTGSNSTLEDTPPPTSTDSRSTISSMSGLVMASAPALMLEQRPLTAPPAPAPAQGASTPAAAATIGAVGGAAPHLAAPEENVPPLRRASPPGSVPDGGRAASPATQRAPHGGTPGTPRRSAAGAVGRQPTVRVLRGPAAAAAAATAGGREGASPVRAMSWLRPGRAAAAMAAAAGGGGRGSEAGAGAGGGSPVAPAVPPPGRRWFPRLSRG